ncbi:MAG: hypothetical protein E3J72_10345 [Planctomycetota bacterium]|nr:MAG: hypothetical protein E3J72_10345 [Planctomycetota bacterium]
MTLDPRPSTLDAFFMRGIDAMSVDERAALAAALEVLEPSSLVKGRGKALFGFLGRIGKLGLEATGIAGEKLAEAFRRLSTPDEDKEPTAEPADDAEAAPTFSDIFQSLKTTLKDYSGSEELVIALKEKREKFKNSSSPEELASVIISHLSRLAELAGGGESVEKGTDAGGHSQVFSAVITVLAREYGISTETDTQDIVLKRVVNRVFGNALEKAYEKADEFDDSKTRNAISIIDANLRSIPDKARNSIAEFFGPAALEPAALWNMFRKGKLADHLATSQRESDAPAIAAGMVVDAVSTVSLDITKQLALYGTSAILAVVVFSPFTALLFAAGLGTYLYRRAAKSISLSLLETASLKIIQSAACSK